MWYSIDGLHFNYPIIVKLVTFSELYITSRITNHATIAYMIVAGSMNVAMTPKFNIGAVQDKLFQIAGKGRSCFVRKIDIWNGLYAWSMVRNHNNFFVRKFLACMIYAFRVELNIFSVSLGRSWRIHSLATNS